MKSFSIFILFLILSSCADQQVPRDKAAIDSLTTALAQKTADFDSMKADYHSWVVHTFDTENHCINYAQIVEKHPTNSVFIVNWIKRNFQWTHSWKKRKTGGT